MQSSQKVCIPAAYARHAHRPHCLQASRIEHNCPCLISFSAVRAAYKGLHRSERANVPVVSDSTLGKLQGMYGRRSTWGSC